MRHFLPLLVLSLAAVACGQRAPAPAPVAPSAPQPPALSMTVTPTTIDDSVLATVNGQPVTISDVRMALRLTRADQDPEEAQLGPALEGLIRQEIIVQAAVGIGLDKDPKYQADYAKAAAPLNAFRRRALGDAYYHAKVAALPPPTDAEAQQFFDANREILASEVHVQQILTRDLARANAALQEVQAGNPFDDVARDLLPPTADNQKPWDGGWQPWQLVPEPWRGALAKLKPGEVSGVIVGPAKRFWVLKLLERRPSKTADFAQAKAEILKHLTDQRAEAARAHVGDELMGAAKIVRHQAPPHKPAPVEE